MINIDQIQSLSKRYQINDYIVAREYVQILLLKEIYSEGFSKDLRPFVGISDRDNLGNLFDYINKCLIEIFKKQV